jgi:hypothetical protein
MLNQMPNGFKPEFLKRNSKGNISRTASVHSVFSL